ncbi:MAG: holo-[acyl-carrier-protein] synthase [Ruminiclostridium sp.]|nr:holo-[acyl-carrier-protein] synthase [Ruminiclostridium sp.]
MAVLCGVDIVEIDRIKKSFDSCGDSFRDRVFTGNEIKYCESKKRVRFESYAARFAAKEAVSKALGTGISKGVNWKDMEILNDPHGKPYVILTEKAGEIYEEMKAKGISLSLSHCSNYAVAYAVIEV